MVLKATQDRVGTLIKDTITLLCKNGLEFQKRFTIEAVIGVTLDDGDIFLMSMNELIKSDNAPPSDQEDDGQAPDTTSEKRSTSKSKSSPHKSHKRKIEDPTTPDIKVKVKKEPGVSDQDESRDQEDSGGTVNPKTEELWGGGDPPSVAPDDSDSQQYYSEQMTADNQRTNNDDPQPDDDNDEDDENIDDEEDLVFIKEEASDTPSRPSCSRQRSFPGRSPQGQYSPGSASFSSPQGFSFSGVSLEALSQDSSSMWSQASQQQRGQNFSRVSTATSASFNQSPQQWQQQQSPAQGQQQVAISSRRQNCSFCGKIVRSKNGLKLHEDRHKGKFPYHCPYCNKGFMASVNLQGHIASHTGVSEFSCTICGKNFNYKHILKDHILKHENGLI